MIVEVKLGSPGLLLTWQQPHHDIRMKVDKYELRYRPDGTEQWTRLSVLNETCLLNNLLPARTYQVQVRAISVVGRSELAGDWSEVVEETTFGREFACECARVCVFVCVRVCVHACVC